MQNSLVHRDLAREGLFTISKLLSYVQGLLLKESSQDPVSNKLTAAEVRGLSIERLLTTSSRCTSLIEVLAERAASTFAGEEARNNTVCIGKCGSFNSPGLSYGYNTDFLHRAIESDLQTVRISLPKRGLHAAELV